MTEHVLRDHSSCAKKAIVADLAIFGVVLLLMMTLGVIMRLNQGGWISLDPQLFYEVMTVHGTGMVGAAGVGGAAVLWYFLGRHVQLSTGVFVFNLVAFVIGASMILGAAFIGHFAAAWTFLMPLPANSLGAWSTGAAACHLFGLLLIGTGFLVLHIESGRAIIKRYGSLAAGLGWPHLFGGAKECPPAAVVAGTMVTISQILGLVPGASVIVLTLINLFVPSFAVDDLLVKNMIYFFGHVFTNATMYTAIIVSYELLPVYAGRPYHVNKVFLAGWTVSSFMIFAAYPHHLFMDFGMPMWMVLPAQVFSYLSGIPVMVITAYGALMTVYRSGMRWSVPAGLIFIATFGWASGIIPGITDATIAVNAVMHNTLWVPGHFHTYFLIGQISLCLGFMAHLAAGRMKAPSIPIAFWLFLLGAIGLTQVFLLSGRYSIPRRFAEYLPQWQPYAQAGAIAGIMVLAGATLLVGRYLMRLKHAVDA